ncbi:MAG: phosphodiesterase [Armatimonadota bacterium]
MLLGVISDTHGNLTGWQTAWDKGLGDADVIFHCGDVMYHGPNFTPVEGYNPKALAHKLNTCSQPLFLVLGNGDSEVDQAQLRFPPVPYVFASLEGVRVLAVHGHVQTPDELLPLAQAWGIDLLFTGHTHVPTLNRVGRVVHLNPGSVTYPLAKQPELHKPTFALVRDGHPEVLDLYTGDVVLSL